ncbi:hypothetical protein K488DRAFT_67227 [Vararia minispora EC-137]|uniref:Uncharacterized protein n=1 Tax=Vararia minispora EC-137 TaxID=1314806 RepID=A0ACB8QZ02_9AGAM|nr:hypothetical protein K488DRAFT_67227 [Vararia minispora EC-137]
MDATPVASRSKKRSLPNLSPERASRSDQEHSEPSRDRREKRRRRKKRKISVVQETDGLPSSSRLSRSRGQFEANLATPSPEPVIVLPSISMKVECAASPEPEFIQGSSVIVTRVKTLAIDADSEETTTLKQSLAVQTESLQAHEALLTSLLPSLTCQVCLDLLHKPFVLAPCGHMACYSCLISWFTTPPANDNVHELPIYRKKTCPHCRGVVRSRPAEVWGVKDMVVNVVKSGLAVNFPAPPTDDANAALAGAGRDPWVNIFHPLPVVGGGVPQPVEGDRANLGIFDAEDGVYRCIDCMHEIWEGSCAQCGRIYPGRDVDLLGDSEGEDDVTHMVNALRNGLVNGFHPVQHFLDLVADEHYSDEDGASDASYESSFIDDEDVVARPHGDRTVIDLTSDWDGSSDEDEMRQLGRGWRNGTGRAPSIAFGSDDEGGEVVSVPAVRGRLGRVVMDDEEEESDRSISGDLHSEDDGAIAGPARRLQRYVHEASPGFCSDEEHSEDDYSNETSRRYEDYDDHIEQYDDSRGAEDGRSDDEYERGDGEY